MSGLLSWEDRYDEAEARITALENALRRVLELGQLDLHYQPQIALDSGRIIGVDVAALEFFAEVGILAKLSDDSLQPLRG